MYLFLKTRFLAGNRKYGKGKSGIAKIGKQAPSYLFGGREEGLEIGDWEGVYTLAPPAGLAPFIIFAFRYPWTNFLSDSIFCLAVNDSQLLAPMLAPAWAFA